jgi:hypothetical protein
MANKEDNNPVLPLLLHSKFYKPAGTVSMITDRLKKVYATAAPLEHWGGA